MQREQSRSKNMLGITQIAAQGDRTGNHSHSLAQVGPQTGYQLVGGQHPFNPIDGLPSLK